MGSRTLPARLSRFQLSRITSDRRIVELMLLILMMKMVVVCLSMLLMQKLDRTGTATSIAESLGVSIVNGALLNAQHASSIEPNVQPSECILLRNMFDPTETQPDFDMEIQEDVQEECSKFGSVKHIYVEKNSIGSVYLRFDSAASAASCQGAMHGRAISTTFMNHKEYEAKFGRGA